MWWPVGAELADVCTVVASDLPGNADSPARGDHTLDRLALDLAQGPALRTHDPARTTSDSRVTSGFTAFAVRVWVRVSCGPYVAE